MCSPRVGSIRRRRKADFTDALKRIVLGTERKVLMTPSDRRRTRYHEAGQ
jgi:ATP-dependent Zn protease